MRERIGILLLLAAFAAQAQMTCRRLDTAGAVRSEGVNELLPDIVLSCSGGAGAAAYEILVTANVPLASRQLTASLDNTGMVEAMLLVDEPQFAAQAGCAPLAAGACSSDANVFQGRQIQENAIAFRRIPITAPGSGSRILRIVNLRARMAGSGGLDPRLTVQMTETASGNAVNLQNSELPAASAKPGLVFSVRTAGDAALPLPGPALTLPPASVPTDAPRAAQSFNVKFTEGFAGAFRRRNMGTSSDDPLFTTIQAVPGVRYNTESGLFNSLLPSATGMNAAGLADSGTRLRIRLQNIPSGISVWVSPREIAAGTTGYNPDAAKALLTAADNLGAGALTVQKPVSGSYVQIPVTGGVATAVWEVVSSDPAEMEDFSFSVAITAAASPGQGTAAVSGALGPLATGDTAPIPAFTDLSVATPAFAVSNVITVPSLNVVSSAAIGAPLVAPESIATAFGSGLASATAVLEAPLSTELASTGVYVIDTEGARRAAALYLVSPGQINFVVPAATAVGPALVEIRNTVLGRVVATGVIQVERVAPGVFSANGTGEGPASGQALRYRAGSTTTQPLAVWDEGSRRMVASPVATSPDDIIFLTLYATGIRNRADISTVHVTLDSVEVPVISAEMHGGIPGLDQVRCGPVPASLAGRGTVRVGLSAGDRASNTVTVEIR